MLLRSKPTKYSFLNIFLVQQIVNNLLMQKSATYEHVVAVVTEILPPMVKFRALTPKIIGTKVKTRQMQN